MTVLINQEVVKRYRNAMQRYKRMAKFAASYADWHDLYTEVGRVTVELSEWNQALHAAMNNRRERKKSTEAFQDVIHQVEVRQFKTRQVARVANHKLLKLELGIYN